MSYEIVIPKGFTPQVNISKDKVVVQMLPDENTELNIDEMDLYHKGIDLGILSGDYSSITINGNPLKNLDEVSVRDFVEIEPINLPDIQPKINGFAFSERGDIAFLENDECIVILTYKGEIQLNQSCNFRFTRAATVEEIVKLDKALRDQKALMIEDHRVQPWKPCHNEKYHSFSSSVSEYTYMGDVIDKECMVNNNMFPIGFITEERKNQYFETVSKLFDSWRE